MSRLPATTVYYGLEFLTAMPAFVFTAVHLVRDLHMSPLQLVLMGTVMEATIFVSEIPTGVLADTYSRRASIIVSLVVQGGAIMLVGVSREPLQLFLGSRVAEDDFVSCPREERSEFAAHQA